MYEGYFFEEVIAGHVVTLQISEEFGVSIYVNYSVKPLPAEEADGELRVKLALAARRLWREALEEIPPGVYWCYPASPDLRQLYLRAGWKPSPEEPEELVYYHRVAPPEGKE